jgi:hypothetical protein
VGTLGISTLNEHPHEIVQPEEQHIIIIIIIMLNLRLVAVAVAHLFTNVVILFHHNTIVHAMVPPSLSFGSCATFSQQPASCHHHHARLRSSNPLAIAGRRRNSISSFVVTTAVYGMAPSSTSSSSTSTTDSSTILPNDSPATATLHNDDDDDHIHDHDPLQESNELLNLTNLMISQMSFRQLQQYVRRIDPHHSNNNNNHSDQKQEEKDVTMGMTTSMLRGKLRSLSNLCIVREDGTEECSIQEDENVRGHFWIRRLLWRSCCSFPLSHSIVSWT